METVRLTRADDVATLTIDRAVQLNALDEATLRGLAAHLGELAAVPPRVLLVRTAGDRVFCAGADIQAMSEMTTDQARVFSELGHTTLDALEAIRCPVVAVVQGAALGGGLELVLACDFVLASKKARFGLPETNLGLIPGFGGCSRLPRRVGAGLARELIYSGRILSADEADRAGLVTRLVEPDALAAEAERFAAELVMRPPLALARAKVALRAAETSDARTAARVEIEAFGGLFGTEDTREGLTAFLARRSPSFRGR
jgi:enoyl-CoA hydratase